MYELFYGFREKPFSLLPDPEFLFLGGQYKTALSLLEFGLLNQAGFIVITGEPGTGKTTLLRKLLSQEGQQYTVGMLTNTHQSLGQLLPWILSAYGLSADGRDPAEVFKMFAEFVRHEAARNRQVLLIVDEAQNLGPDLLEELRLLSNLNTDKQQCLQVILSGQPKLRELVRAPELKQFAQRVAVDYNLGPMHENETAQYIRHRVKVAGGPDKLFSEQCCRLAHIVTGGVPRLINQVCDTALTYGYAEQAPRITGRLLAAAVKDRRAGGLTPLLETNDEWLKDEPPAAADPGSRPPTQVSMEASPRGVAPLRVAAERVTRVGPDSSKPPVHGASSVAAWPERVTPILSEPPRPSAPPAPPPSPPMDRARVGAESAKRQSAPPAVPSPPFSSPEAAPQKPSAVTLYEQGLALKKAGRSKEAAQVLLRSAQDPRLSMKAFTDAGLCVRDVGRMAEAVELFHRALTSPPQSEHDKLMAHYELGRTFEMLGRRDEAIESYEAVHAKDPHFGDVAKRLERLGVLPGELNEEPSRISRAWGGLLDLIRPGKRS